MEHKKKILYFLTLLTMLLILIPHSEVNAATTKMNVKSKSITVGQTVKIKLLNNNKKVKWSVSNGKIRITKKSKSYAKIKGIRKGTAYLKAKVGKKTYKCKITVKTKSSNNKSNTETFNASKAKKNMKITRCIANSQVVVILTSNYSVPTNIKAKCTFYDSSGNAVDYDSDSVSYLEKTNKCILTFDIPKVEYSTYTIDYEYTEGLKYFYHKSIINNLSLSTNFVDDKYSPYIMATVSNSAKYDCYYYQVGVIYYDKFNNIVAVDTDGSSVDAGSSNSKKLYIPYDRKTYKDIEYDHYEVFLTYAYHLGK